MATALIVNRGALAEPISDPEGSRKPTPNSVAKNTKLQSPELKPELQWNIDDASPEKWIVPDWTYVFFPKMPVLRMPYNELVRSVRRALEQLKREALKLQATYDHLERTTAKSTVISSSRTTKLFDYQLSKSQNGKTASSGQPGPSKAPRYIKTQAHKPKYSSMISHETASKRILPIVEDEVQDEKLHQDFMEEMRKLRDSLPSSNQSLDSRAGASSSHPESSYISSELTTSPQRGHTPMRQARKPRSNSRDMGGVSTEHTTVQALSGTIEVAARPVLRSSRRMKVAHASPQTPANQGSELDAKHKLRSPPMPPHETLVNTSARLFRGRPLVMPSSDGQTVERSTNPVSGRKTGDERK